MKKGKQHFLLYINGLEFMEFLVWKSIQSKDKKTTFSILLAVLLDPRDNCFSYWNTHTEALFQNKALFCLLLMLQQKLMLGFKEI